MAPPRRSAGGDVAPAKPERWQLDVGSADVALLVIPASLQRRRVFQIDVRFVVRVPESAIEPWHAMDVDLNGQREWSRRLASHGPTDSLDYHCRRELDIGQALRIRAATHVGGTFRTRLVIEAEEDRD
jgi:hypothetical protein